MPVALERKLKRQVAGKKMSKERKDAYVYGTLRKTGWKPKREREKNLSARLDSLIQFKKGDYPPELADLEERQKRGRASAAGLIIPSVGQTAVGLGTLGAIGIKDREIAKHDRPLMQKLNIEAGKAGGTVEKSVNPLVPGVAWRKNKGFLGRVQRSQVEKITGQLNPPEQGVAISPGIRKPLKPGILAHEIGHLQQPKWMSSGATGAAIGTLGQWGPIGTSLYAGLTEDEQRAKMASIAGTATAAPMLIREADASIRGGKLLARHGVKGIRRISPGIGLATYASAAALPYATYRTKKAFSGYKEMSAMLDDLIQFKTKQQLLGIPGLEYQSRRDPEERLRDRMVIAASAAKTAAGLGIATAGGVGAYQLHKHGKGILGEARSAIQGAGKIGPSIEAINEKLDRAEAWTTKIAGDPAAHETVKIFNRGAKFLAKHPRIARLIGKMGKATFQSTDKPIEFDASILGPWQGPSGYECKIDQEQFPAELSPLALLQLPFPQLMAYLNQRNLQQQVFASEDNRVPFANSYHSGEYHDTGEWVDKDIKTTRNSITGLSIKLDGLIEFAGLQSAEAIENIFGRGRFGGGNVKKIFGGIRARGINPALGSPKLDFSRAATGGITGATPLDKLVAARSGINPAIASTIGTQSMATGAPAQKIAAAVSPKVAAAVSPVEATNVAQQAGQAAAATPAAPGGSWNDWSKYSWKKKLAIGAGAGLAGGAAGAYLMKPGSNQQQMSAWLDDVIEFAGGYVNTEEGVKKERGVGAHFNRAAGRYIGLPFGLLGVGAGYFVDRSRRRHNILKTKFESNQPWFSKGPAMLSAKLDDLIEFDNRPRNAIGEFQPQGEGGPDPNAMAKTYKQPGPGLGPAVATGAAGGLAGEGAIMAFRKLLEKIKRAKR